MNLEQLARKCLDACGGPDDALPHVLDVLMAVRNAALDDAVLLLAAAAAAEKQFPVLKDKP